MRAADGAFDAGAALESHYNPLMLELRDLPMPFVTAVHGAAAGVGCSIGLMGDLIVADTTWSCSTARIRCHRTVSIPP